LVWVHETAPPFAIFTAAHLPSPTESFFQRVDEIAYDEEDSTRAEDHSIVALTILDYGAPLASRSLSAFAPASSHTPPVVTMPILRC
jgi:hypothetical protein